MQVVKHGKTINEARVGNFNTALRSKVLKFLKDAGREDIEIQKLSNVAVNWTVDAGKTELDFEFTCDSDSYEINVKDGKGEKVETWAPQESIAELTDDLNDTLSFIDEFKNSLNTKVSPAKAEAVEESGEDDDDELDEDEDEELNESEDDDDDDDDEEESGKIVADFLDEIREEAFDEILKEIRERLGQDETDTDEDEIFSKIDDYLDSWEDDPDADAENAEEAKNIVVGAWDSYIDL